MALLFFGAACGCQTETYESNDPSWPGVRQNSSFLPPNFQLKRPTLDALGKLPAPGSTGQDLPTITPGSSN